MLLSYSDGPKNRTLPGQVVIFYFDVFIACNILPRHMTKYISLAVSSTAVILVKV